MESELTRELHAQVAQPPNRMHRNQVTREGAAVAQSIEGRDPGAQQRTGFAKAKGIGNAGKAAHRRDHVLLIPAIEVKAGNLEPDAVDEIAAAARVALAAIVSVPADADPVANRPCGHARTNGINDTRDLMPGHPGISSNQASDLLSQTNRCGISRRPRP